ncbi:hypothetical protein F0562_026744 [Nyssa sinensis]|uniref:Uncharacterized protein n=1 Tax=Nyssa sinensis TaxID=561372 RepID=A0A5J5BDT4_9ASTE|nr:hypothetical protein F0562_026744 [Nyssa sinensis]
MSIEEAGLREMEIMNKWQEINAKLLEEANSSWHKDSRKLRPDEEDEDDDAAQEKARAWDDWKNDHPRGAGNKKLTPCGALPSVEVLYATHVTRSTIFMLKKISSASVALDMANALTLLMAKNDSDVQCNSLPSIHLGMFSYEVDFKCI